MNNSVCPFVPRLALPVCPVLDEESEQKLDELAELTVKAVLPIIQAWQGVGVQYMRVGTLPSFEQTAEMEGVSQEDLDSELALRVSRKLLSNESVAAVALSHFAHGNTLNVELSGTDEERDEGAAALARLLCNDVIESARNGTTEAMLNMQSWVSRRLCKLTQQNLVCPDYKPNCHFSSYALTQRVCKQLNTVGEEVLSPVDRLMWRLKSQLFRFRYPERTPGFLRRVFLRMDNWRGV